MGGGGFRVGRHIILNNQLPKPVLESGKFGHHGQSIKIGQQIISVKVVMKKNANFSCYIIDYLQ